MLERFRTMMNLSIYLSFAFREAKNSTEEAIGHVSALLSTVAMFFAIVFPYTRWNECLYPSMGNSTK